MREPLKGVKIVELATWVAIPFCARFFADLGADVIKVESKEGDGIRFAAEQEGRPLTQYENVAFDLENANKKGIVLDLKASEGIAVMMRLLAQADVFLTNLRVPALQKLGLDYETLHAKFPSLVVGIVTGYGLEGPDKDLPGYDLPAFFSRSGILGSLYEKGTMPMNPVIGFGDHTTGMFLAPGVLAALFYAKNTGNGELVSSSLFHSAVFVQGILLLAAQYTETATKWPISRRDAANPLINAFETKDGRWLQFAMPLFDKFFPRFMEAIGRPDQMDNPKYTEHNIAETNCQSEVYDIVREQISKKTFSEWATIMREYDIPYSLAQSWEEVLQDPQAWASHIFDKVKYSTGNERTLIRPPVLFKEMGLPEYKPGPLLGEHSRKIIEDLGYTSEEIEDMRKKEVFLDWKDIAHKYK
jgi:cinnamoyl-CoA:phenyllactate CoA-transferase